MRLVLLLAVCGAFVGCAAGPPLPLAQNICVQSGLETTQETAYLRRKVAERLTGYYLTLSDGPCDVTSTFEPLGKFQAEVLRSGLLFRTEKGYWSMEGLIQVKQGQKVIVQDESVNLRGYSSKQDLLDALARQISYSVTGYFQSPSLPVKAK